MGREILNKEALSLSEVKASLDKINKRDEEMGFRANKAHEYVKALKPLSQKDFKELNDKINALEVPRLKDIHVKKIIDLMPVSLEDLKFALSSYTITVNSDNLKKIIDVVKNFRK
jgi:DNA-directed RNA polymerase subunit F